MSAANSLVRRFHEAFGHPVGRVPHVPADRTLRRLRLSLILEDVRELAHAFGMDVEYQILADGPDSTRPAGLSTRANLERTADALGDIDYVVTGTFVVCGIPQLATACTIHESNMSKLGADGKPIVRADGKILKGPNYVPPQWDWLHSRILHGESE